MRNLISVGIVLVDGENRISGLMEDSFINHTLVTD